ncbi:MAG TPA: DUF5706 domain-containing protein [Saprospiraceae bacterium]|nr:DUF5706 domain-containing protein [Saprospiraceae bacterium]HMP23532.1 DUF5706 domain-containing protein [Saprospiraceae bacterium]
MTRPHPVLQSSEAYITQLLSEELSDDHRFHDLNHTLAVRDTCLSLARSLEIPSEDLEMLELAALFHDTGYTVTYTGHEAESRRIATDFLLAQNYPTDRLEQVLDCIDVTHPGAHPQNLVQQIIRDADYFNLASTDYLASIEALRHEWAVFLQQTYADPEWYRLNYDFLKNHQYITPAARALFEPQKTANLKQLKKIVKQQAPKPETAPAQTIADSRSAQMMFKTALRNHLDLSNLADNKANIMLSVNALIITVAIPLLASYMQTVPYLLYPMSVLIVCCLSSMVFATLATRPIKMNGYTPKEKIEQGESNLFFFGNFYRMSFAEYQAGMQQVIANSTDLENAIMRDLFFLGKSLGTKYRQLRTCYTVFMFGMVLTVLVFVVSYSLQG